MVNLLCLLSPTARLARLSTSHQTLLTSFWKSMPTLVPYALRAENETPPFLPKASSPLPRLNFIMLLTQSLALKFGECGSKTEPDATSNRLLRVAEEFDFAFASAVMASSRFSSSAVSGVFAWSLSCGLIDPKLDSCSLRQCHTS